MSGAKWIITVAVTAGVVLALAAGGAGAKSDSSADAYLHRLMANYAAMDSWPARYDPCGEFCDASLKALMVKTQRLFERQGDAFLDYDPVCQCNGGPPANKLVSSRAVGADRYEARLSRIDDGKTVEWTVVLRRRAGGWKIYDVIEPNLGGLRARLSKAATACIAARKAHPHAESPC